MNKLTKPISYESIYLNGKCKLCGFDYPDHEDDCAGLLLSNTRLSVYAYVESEHSNGYSLEWVESELESNAFNKKEELTDELIRQSDHEEILIPDIYNSSWLYNKPTESILEKTEFFIELKGSYKIEMDKKEIKDIAFAKHFAVYKKKTEERKREKAKTKMDKAIAELNKIKDLIKDGIYEQKMLEINKEYEDDMAALIK